MEKIPEEKMSGSRFTLVKSNGYKELNETTGKSINAFVHAPFYQTGERVLFGVNSETICKNCEETIGPNYRHPHICRDRNSNVNFC